jgi:hypothetical protein
MTGLLRDLHSAEKIGLRGALKIVPVKTVCAYAGVSESGVRRLLNPTENDRASKSEAAIRYGAYALVLCSSGLQGVDEFAALQKRSVDLKRTLIHEVKMRLASPEVTFWGLIRNDPAAQNSFLVRQWLSYLHMRSQGLERLDVFSVLRMTDQSINLLGAGADPRIEYHNHAVSTGWLRKQVEIDVAEEILFLWPEKD